MYGGVGRDTQYLKHGMQISFDQSDGASCLNENIFGDGYLPDGLVLRQASTTAGRGAGPTPNSSSIVDPRRPDGLGDAEHAGDLGPAFRQRAVLGNVQRGGPHRLGLRRLLLRRPEVGLRRLPLQRFTGFEVNSGTMTPWDDMFNVATYGNIAGTGTASPDRAGQPDGLRADVAVPQPAGFLRLHHRQLLRRPTGTGTGTTTPPSTARRWGFVFQDWDGEGMLLNADDGTSAPTSPTATRPATPRNSSCNCWPTPTSGRCSPTTFTRT